MRILVALCVFLVTACAVVKTKRAPKRQKSTESNETLEDNWSTGVSLDLRGRLRRSFALEAALTDYDRNLICSPISAFLPLGKLALGADGNVLEELFQAIGIRPKSKLKRSFKRLIKSLQYLSGVTLGMASRLYSSKDVRLKSSFVEDSKSIFDSGVERISFSQPQEAANEINRWVERETNGMIPNIISPTSLSSGTSLILVNAIYFAGKWKYPFENVKTETFFSPRGSRKVPMMSVRYGEFNYYESETLKAQLLEIPYVGNGASLIVVLPYANDGLPVLLRKLKFAPELLNSSLKKMISTRIMVKIPKFKLQTELDLKVLYEKLGLRYIFREPGLTQIATDTPLVVSKAVQKAVIVVNERGTEAGAASVLDLVPAAGFYNPISFNATRPFLFYVRANKDQLFAGIFNEP